jgi:D-alanyl-D-alanine carboxypeptidase
MATRWCRHAAGYSDTETKAGFAPNTHVRAGSISKTFVAATVLQLVADTPVPTAPMTADQLLDMALSTPAQFAPGSEMPYTNTNYVIAGLLIEAVTGVPAADEVTRRSSPHSSTAASYLPGSSHR